MVKIKEDLEAWGNSLLNQIDVVGLNIYNPVAYKWRTPFYARVQRELVSWRLHDLLTQAHNLLEVDAILGARILLRSALETLCVLIFINKKLENIVDGKIKFIELEKSIERLFWGSKNDPEFPDPINIMTMIAVAEKKYPGIQKTYDELCESAHPNLTGMGIGYSKNYLELVGSVEIPIRRFGNFWKEKFEDEDTGLTEEIIEKFFSEYNGVSKRNFESLEKWLVENNDLLEAEKSNSDFEPTE